MSPRRGRGGGRSGPPGSASLKDVERVGAADTELLCKLKRACVNNVLRVFEACVAELAAHARGDPEACEGEGWARHRSTHARKVFLMSESPPCRHAWPSEKGFLNGKDLRTGTSKGFHAIVYSTARGQHTVTRWWVCHMGWKAYVKRAGNWHPISIS